MIARQAYLRYVQASGGQRVGKESQRLFNQTVSRALRAGSVNRISDGVPGLVKSTLYLPEQEPVKLRDLGPRTIFDVPESELSALLDLLAAQGIPEDELPREVLNAYGLRKLTYKTSAHILANRHYEWTP